MMDKRDKGRKDTEKIHDLEVDPHVIEGLDHPKIIEGTGHRIEIDQDHQDVVVGQQTMIEIVIKTIESIKKETSIMIEKDMIGEAVVLSEK